MHTQKDATRVRDLAARVADIAADPVQEEKRALWRKLNDLEPVRPMVMIDQICWHELDADGALTLQCEDPNCRAYEQHLRRTLYQWRHFPVDRVVEPWIDVPMAIHNSGFGIRVQDEIAISDPTNPVVGHKFANQFQSDDDLEKIRMPHVEHDPAETERRLDIAHQLFDGRIAVRPRGYDPAYLSLWDPVSMWMGVENALYALVDRPEFMHRLLARVTDSYQSLLDQLESQGWLCGPQSLVHCTGAYTDELPAPGYDPQSPRTRDLWMLSMAQMFSTVSPAMFKEFEVDYVRRFCRRFGRVYYGCCEPLDGKMAEVRMLPNVRKISMSPWVDPVRGAAAIGGAYVFSRKPNPAFVATDVFRPETIRQDLATTRKICEAHGCPLEFILKDISTVRYQPERLDEWARIAMRIAADA